MVFVFDSVSPYCWKNSVAVSMYFCRTSFNFVRLRPDFQTAQSSANSNSLTPLLEAGMSLTRSRNRSGRITLPCGQPFVTSHDLDIDVPTRT